MNVGSVNWNWREVEAVLESLAASEQELIICRGQAVAYWSQRYGLTPITSRDLDVVADREIARRMADRLVGTASYPGRYDMTVLTAVIRVAWIVARSWLSNLMESNGPHGLRLIHQWYRTARQRPNRRILESMMLDWKSLIPLEALLQRQTSEPLIARFLSEQWPRIEQE
jgi:hypothetical protein